MFSFFSGGAKRGAARLRKARGRARKDVVAPAPSRASTNETAVIGGKEVGFLLTESRRARGVYLKINPEKGLEVVVPRRYRISELPRLLHQKENWILKNLQKVAEKQKRQVKFADGAQMEILGVTKTIRICDGQNVMVLDGQTILTKSHRVIETENEIIVSVRGSAGVAADGRASGEHAGAHALTHAGAITRAQHFFEKHLRKRITAYFMSRTAELARQMETHYGKISVRGQRSRWGSCSRKNDLSLNWKLIFFEVAVVDYVIIHELAHTVHHNHSRKFYALVETFCPDYKNLRRILRSGGSMPAEG